jgi:hypothetical protein
MAKNKNLSYFANKKKTKDMHKPIQQPKKGNIFRDIAIVFLIIIVVSISLRFVNEALASKGLTLNPFHVATAQAATPELAGEFFNQSHTYVNIRPDAGFTFTLEYKNVGTETWTRESVYLKSKTTALKFRHDFWPDPFHPAQLQQETVEPGDIGTFKFALTAPKNYNLYKGEFIVVSDNILIQAPESQVVMNVVEDPENTETPSEVPDEEAASTPEEETPVPQPEPTTPSETCTLEFVNAEIPGALTTDNVSCVDKFNLPAEGPDIRIGLFHSDEPITIVNTERWEVRDSADRRLAVISAGEEVAVFYDPASEEYSLPTDDDVIETSRYFTMPNRNDGVFTITSYHNIPSYNPNIDYNDFIGDLELRYNDHHERTWLIETLPMETYLKGIQETTNYDPIEYLKTMSVAARTYAMYHWDRATKHKKEFFHVDSKYDQVYKGYVSMQIFSRVGEAVDATTGIVGTYEDKIIVAPYFSRSDGRTRSFEEVWYVHVPYLISVPTPYTEGRDLFGHGVGIDATDALNRAYSDGSTYEWLLKYYYTGIGLETLY